MNLTRSRMNVGRSCVSRPKHLLPHCAALAIISLPVLLAACGLGEVATVEPHVDITYQNNTDSLLCVSGGTGASPVRRVDCSTKVEPMKRTTESPECVPDIETGGTSVVIIEDVTGDVIYGRTALCREWIDAGSTITIDKQGDRFVITDGFPEETGGR